MKKILRLSRYYRKYCWSFEFLGNSYEKDDPIYSIIINLLKEFFFSSDALILQWDGPTIENVFTKKVSSIDIEMVRSLTEDDFTSSILVITKDKETFNDVYNQEWDIGEMISKLKEEKAILMILSGDCEPFFLWITPTRTDIAEFLKNSAIEYEFKFEKSWFS